MKNLQRNAAREITGAMLDEMKSAFVRVSDARDLDKACKCPKEVLLCNICENLFKLPAAVCDNDASAKTTPLKNIDLQEVDIEGSDVAWCVLSIVFSTLLYCVALNIEIGKEYDKAEPYKSSDIGSKTIREICYRLARPLATCGTRNSFCYDITDFLCDFLELSKILNIDVYYMAKRMNE